MHVQRAHSPRCVSENARCAPLIVFVRLVPKLEALTESLFPPDVIFDSKMNVTD